ncbi:hypothetical protein [Streptomyces wuyuanensis]|uniref:hypothetical protein n=1 Tax=Streptomyces wuyuanensis TaxID=1196353 RepID=UPI0034137C66
MPSSGGLRRLLHAAAVVPAPGDTRRTGRRSAMAIRLALEARRDGLDDEDTAGETFERARHSGPL